MKILVLNSGAKDTAIAWWLSKSKLIEELYVAPGNPGTSEYAINLPDIDTRDSSRILDVCSKYGINHVVIGTEDPLLAGVADALNANGIAAFGAPLSSLRLETDRVYAREFASRCGIRTPGYRVFDRIEDLSYFLNNEGKGGFHTLKPNGFAMSRDIINSSDIGTIESFARPMLKKGPVLLEEHIEGIPLTLTLLTDMSGALLLPACSEYTKREHDDSSIVTGGMGAVSPVPMKNETNADLGQIIVQPLLRQLKKENLMYRGVLTLALVINAAGPCIVDFHLRFNDPAAQTILPLIRNDAVDILSAMENNTLSDVVLETSDKCAVSVVIASEGYPQKPRKGLRFRYTQPQLLDSRLNDRAMVFLGAVDRDANGNLVTSGGRSATVVGFGSSITQANAEAYRAAATISFKGSWYREDIGNKFFTSVADWAPGRD